MANEDGQPPDKITEEDMRTMCMMQLLFKRKCMLYADLKAACKEIMKSDSGALRTCCAQRSDLTVEGAPHNSVVSHAAASHHITCWI